MNIHLAKEYALNYLKTNIGPDFFYHNIEHTLDVFNSVKTLALSENTKPNDLILLQTAALFHDTGIHLDYFNHEEVSVGISKKVLPGFGYNEGQIKIISKLIMDTCIKCKPKSKLGEILSDADLDYLGREDYFDISNLLRKEWEVCGVKKVTDNEWYTYQLNYMNNHQYYSDAAKKSRNQGKLKNVARLEDLLISL